MPPVSPEPYYMIEDELCSNINQMSLSEFKHSDVSPVNGKKDTRSGLQIRLIEHQDEEVDSTTCGDAIISSVHVQVDCGGDTDTVRLGTVGDLPEKQS